MSLLIFLFVFIFGSIIGSFLNVVIYRLGTGRSIVHGRSMCMTCARTLTWYELMPIFSFLIQSGRCRKCGSVISRQYPAVEGVAGALFVAVAWYFKDMMFLAPERFFILLCLFGAMLSLLLIISVYDARHKIIPDRIVYPYAALSFFSIFVNMTAIGGFFIPAAPFAIAAGPVLALPFALLWLVSRGRWMGLGDAKLVLGIGWMLGLEKGTAALMIAFWIGAIVGLVLLAFSKKKVGMKTELPFAPYLIVGALIAFFFGIDISTLVGIFSI